MSGERLVVEGSRWKAVLVLLGCAMFVALGWFLVTQGEWFGWVVAGFFGPGGVVVIVVLLWRGWPSIILDEDGMEFTAVFRKSRFKWTDIDAFFITDISGAKMIGIEFAPHYESLRRTRRWVQRFTGVEGAIANQFELSPEDLCRLLNQWRERHAAKESH